MCRRSCKIENSSMFAARIVFPTSTFSFKFSASLFLFPVSFRVCYPRFSNYFQAFQWMFPRLQHPAVSPLLGMYYLGVVLSTHQPSISPRVLQKKRQHRINSRCWRFCMYCKVTLFLTHFLNHRIAIANYYHEYIGSVFWKHVQIVGIGRSIH